MDYDYSYQIPTENDLELAEYWDEFLDCEDE